MEAYRDLESWHALDWLVAVPYEYHVRFLISSLCGRIGPDI